MAEEKLSDQEILNRAIADAQAKVKANNGKAVIPEDPNPTNMGQLQDQTLSVLSGARRGITSIPGWPGDIQQGFRSARDYLTPSHDPNSLFPVPEDQALPQGLELPTMPTLPTSADIESAYEGANLPKHKPIYPGSEYLEEGASFLPNMFGGEASIPMKLGTRLAAPVVGGELGAKAGKALGNEEAGRLLGTLATGAAGAKGEAMRTLSAVEKAGGPKLISPTREELKAESKRQYDAFVASPVTVKAKPVSDFGTRLELQLKQKGFFDAPTSAPTVHATVRHFLKDRGSNLTAAEWKAARTALGQSAFKGIGSERAAGAMAIRELDGFFKGLSKRQLARGTTTELLEAKQLLEGANSNYGALKRSKTFSDLTHYGGVRATSVNSGMNVGNSIRGRMTSLAEAETKHPSIGLSPEETQGIEDIASGGRMTRPDRAPRTEVNALRDVGNVLGGGGGLGFGLLGVAPAVYNGNWEFLASLGIPIAGRAAKLRSNRLTLRATDEMDKQLRRRSELAGRLGPERTKTSMDPDELWKRALILYELQKQQEQGQGQ